MKHTSAMPPKTARVACVDCGVSMPIGLVRVVSADPLLVKCTNEAACRKRQRHRSMRTKTQGKDT